MTFYGIFNTLMLLGTLQGFILCSMLFFSKKRSRPNRLLGTLILLITLCCLNMWLNRTSGFQTNMLLRFILGLIPLIIIMPVGPLIYFYTKSSLDPDFSLTTRQRLHFIPVVIDLVPQLTMLIYLVGVFSYLISQPPERWSTFIDTYNVYADIPRWLSITAYLWLSARYLSCAKNAHGQQLKWLRQFIRLFFIFQAIWLVYLVPYVIPRLSDRLLDTLDWYPVYIPLVVLIYCLGIKGYMMTPEQEPLTRKASTAPLPSEVVTEALPLLKKAMEKDNLYLEPMLNLSLLAQHTGLPQKTISSVLNRHLQMSFSEYVNGYRVEAFKQKAGEPGQDHLTILGLALDAGFNSQATFQRAFRHYTGMSPREYMVLMRKDRSKTEFNTANNAQIRI